MLGLGSGMLIVIILSRIAGKFSKKPKIAPK